MRKKGWLLCAVVWAAVVLAGCGNAAERKSGTEQSNAGQSNIGQIIGESVDEILAAKEQAVGVTQVYDNGEILVFYENIKDITWEQADYNVVDLHFIFEDTVINREITAYSVQDIVWEDITGDGVEEALIYCDFANNTCDWQLVYFYQIDQGSVTDISPTGEDIPELRNADGELWNMWIAAETMEGYSSPVYKLESYDKEQGEVYVEETLYIGYRDGKWELVQESAFR